MSPTVSAYPGRASLGQGGTPLLEEIDLDLAALTDGVVQAAEFAAGVDAALSRIAAHAAAAGWAGIAEAVGGLRGKVEPVRGRIGRVTELVDLTRRAVRTVSGQRSPEETVVVLTRVIEGLSDLVGHIAGTLSDLDDISRHAARTLDGGRPEPLLARVEGLRAALATAAEHAIEAKRRAQSALSGARATGAEGTAHASVGSPEAADPEGIPEPLGARWGPATELPGRLRSFPAFRARPAGTNRPTAGWFEGGPVESGGRDRSFAADLDHGPLRGPPVTFYQHVESKVAATMRRQQVDEADLVIDNTVCGTNDYDRDQEWACDRILPSILRRGSRLTVWVTRDGGRTWWTGTYVGTGERIRDEHRHA